MPRSPFVKDISGEIRGHLTVVKFLDVFLHGDRKLAKWLCQCECNKLVERFSNQLRATKNRIPSCGCKTKSTRVDSVKSYHREKALSSSRWTITGDEAHYDFGNGLVCRIDSVDVGIVNDRLWHLSKGKSGLLYPVSNSLPKRPIHQYLMGFGRLVDHADGDTLNNRRSNLRYCTASQNQANKRKQAGAKSRYKGVRPCNSKTPKWRCEIECQKKRIYLGTFNSEIEAALAYDRKAIELFGVFAKTNFPQADSSCPK